MILMKRLKRLLWFALVVAALSAILISSPAMARGPWGGGSGGDGGGDRCGCGCNGGTNIEPLTEYEKQALNTAIDEEYYAKAVYETVMNTFGSIEPFYWIARDEQMHINWVGRLLTKYGLPIPADRWSGNIDLVFYSKQQACEIGAQAEATNASVYDAMLPQITHSDIVSTFTKLRDVSQYRHLPAFQNWANIYGSSGQ